MLLTCDAQDASNAFAEAEAVISQATSLEGLFGTISGLLFVHIDSTTDDSMHGAVIHDLLSKGETIILKVSIAVTAYNRPTDNLPLKGRPSRDIAGNVCEL